MRGTSLLTLVILLLVSGLHAQTDSLPKLKPKPKSVLIGEARKELKTAFMADDPAWAALWVDSLTRMEDSRYAGLIWDERWLLYYWEESYGNLFEEVAQFDLDELRKVAQKTQPRGDSLFETIDQTLFERRYNLFSNLQNGFLNAEEKAFSSLLLEYLLRMNKDALDWNRRVAAFVKLYPDSRFVKFIGSTMQEIPVIEPPAKKTEKSGGLSLMFSSINWTGELERTMRPGFAFTLGFDGMKRRRVFAIDLFFGGMKSNRLLLENKYFWPKDYPFSIFGIEAQWGYNILNTNKLRIQPALIGGGMAMLPNISEDDPDATIAESFTYTSAYLGAVLHIDLKFGTTDSDKDWKRHYHGLRVSLGTRWLNFRHDNSALQGNMLYLAVGYAFKV